MAIIETKVNSYQEDYNCDNCHNANLVSIGIDLNSVDPKARYLHKCPSCNITLNLTLVYPNIIYR